MTPRPGSVPAAQALAIGAVATFVHLAVFLTVVFSFHTSLESYTDKGDGQSYKRMASALLGDRTTFTEYDSRVFPGYPALIATVHEITRLPIAASAIFITFTASGIAAACAALVFNDRRVGWAVALALPHAWINMSLAMSEAPVLALELLAILLVRRDQIFSGGMILGLAILTRPVAAFALAGLMLERFARDRPRRGISAAAVASAIFLIGMYLLRFVTAGFLGGIHIYATSPRAYAGQLLTWPFHSIIWMTLHGDVSWARWIYIMTQVALCIAGCVALAQKLPDRSTRLRLALPEHPLRPLPRPRPRRMGLLTLPKIHHPRPPRAGVLMPQISTEQSLAVYSPQRRVVRRSNLRRPRLLITRARKKSHAPKNPNPPNPNPLHEIRRLQRFKSRPTAVGAALGDAMIDFFKNSVAKRQTKLVKLAECWETLIPQMLSAHCALEGLNRGTLTVIVDSSSHLYHLKQLLQSGLEQQILLVCKSTGLKKITLRPGRWYEGDTSSDRQVRFPR